MAYSVRFREDSVRLYGKRHLQRDDSLASRRTSTVFRGSSAPPCAIRLKILTKCIVVTTEYNYQ